MTEIIAERVQSAFSTAVSIPYLLVLIPPLATILLNGLVEPENWGLYGLLTHIVTGLFILWTVMTRVSQSPKDHPSRRRLQTDLLPQVWAFALFLPLMIGLIIAEPTPPQPWPGIGIATAAGVLIIANRRILNADWDAAAILATMCAGLGVASQVAFADAGSFLLESAILYAAYGLGAALVVGSWHMVLTDPGDDQG